MAEADNNFYIRYYVGHKGKFGHEFIEFDLSSDGLVRFRTPQLSPGP